MKTLFDHTRASTLQASTHLLCEIGSYGVSCIWYTVQPLTIRGVRMYHFNEHASGSEVAGHLRQLLNGPDFSGKVIYVCLNQKESMLIPSAHFSHAQLPAMMNLVFGKDDGSLRTDTIHQSEVLGGQLCYNAYRVHSEIISVLGKAVPGAVIHHSSTLQLKCSRSSTSLCVIVYHHIMKLMLFDGNRLRFVQQFLYKTPSDAAYLLLNACHQHGLAPENVSLDLSGIIDKDSNLYREIIKYFLDVNLQAVQEGVELDEELDKVSSHYFSHLTNLVKCVS